MTTGGVVLMVVSVGGTVAFFGWCLWKLFTSPEASKHLHSQANIEPPDVSDDR